MLGLLTGNVARRTLLLGAILLAAAQDSGLAYVIDASRYTPVNYFTFRPPPAGSSYIDPAFGTTITRLTDALNTPDNANVGALGFIGNEYATMSPFNDDNSRLLLQHRSYFALYDDEGGYLRDLPFEITAASEPRWSRHDRNVLYYLTANQLKQYDVTLGIASAVRTFDEYAVVHGRGESDVCFDGDHLVLVGDNRDVFVYDLGTSTKGPVLATAGAGGFDNVHITPEDHVLVSWYASGEGRYRGVELFDRDMNFLRQLSPVIGHMDVTRDVNGEEALLLTNAANPNPPAGCSNAVVKIALADGRVTCLISFDWSLGIHISASDSGGGFIVSTYGWGDPSPSHGWTRYTGEILQIGLDGTTVRRLAQHRSRPFNSYGWTPKASVSRDGTRLVFTSNYGLPREPGYPAEYADAYLIHLATAAPAAAGSTNTLRFRIEQNTGAAAYSGPWYANASGSHSDGAAMLAMDPAARVRFTFAGTGVRWIGNRDEWSGMAKVYIDGVLEAVVDTYAQPALAQQVLFAADGLANGVHTIDIEPAGGRNPQSGGYWVWVDAFETVTRLEESDDAISYSCPSGTNWYRQAMSLHSNAAAMTAMGLGCQATLRFNGSGVSWIANRDEWSGIARVSLDGVLRAEIDTYSSPSAANSLTYTLTGLSPGFHTLTIEPAGRWNPMSTGMWIWIDAFEVAP